MKKSLIAIAVLIAAGAASAETSFGLYGVADVYAGKAKNGDLKLSSGGLAGSRLGFKGTQDLENGLQMHVNLEQGIDLNDGKLSTTGVTFDRQANIGLSGGFGTVKLGRSTTAFDDINGAANSGFDSILSSSGNVWVGYTGRADAQIYYASPDINGISGAVGFTLKGNQATVGATNDVTSLHLKYSNGPIYVGAAYQSEKQVAGAASKHMLFNGTYNLGMATAKAAFRTVKNPANDPWTNPKATEYTFGLDFPVNSKLTLSAGISKSDTKASGLGLTNVYSRRAVGYDLAATYSLFKTTTVYGGFNSYKRDGMKYGLVAAGVSHAF